MNRLKKQIDYAKFTENSIVTLDIDYAERLLLKLTEQYESPTLEEVKKEWEELGWYWHYFYNENGIANKYRITKYVPSRKRDGSGDYQLEIYLCNNTKTFNINFNMDMQEHQLLTKTFKALGWGGYND